jgi:hypothetical protein
LPNGWDLSQALVQAGYACTIPGMPHDRGWHSSKPGPGRTTWAVGGATRSRPGSGARNGSRRVLKCPKAQILPGQ